MHNKETTMFIHGGTVNFEISYGDLISVFVVRDKWLWSNLINIRPVHTVTFSILCLEGQENMQTTASFSFGEFKMVVDKISIMV